MERPISMIGDNFESLVGFCNSEIRYLKSILSSLPNFQFSLDLERDKTSAFNLWIAFEWSKDAFKYLILLRDSVFVLHKAILFNNENRLKENSLDEKRLKLYNVIKDKRTSLFESYDEYIKNIGGQEQLDSLFEKWQYQLNPAGQYLANIDEILTHIVRIQNENAKLIDQQKLYASLKDVVIEENAEIEGELKYFESIIDKVLEHLDKKDEKSVISFNKYLSKIQLELNERKVKLDMPNRIEHFMLKENKLDHVLVGLDESNMLKSDFDFSNRTLSWLESIILPTYINLDQARSKLKSSIKLTIVNLQNYYSITNSETGGENGPSSIFETLENHRSRIAEIRETIETDVDQINSLMNSSFYVGEIFGLKKGFLDLDNAFNNPLVIEGGDRIGKKIQRLYLGGKAYLDRFIAKIKNEESLSIPEKFVRYLDSRKVDENLESYSTIFLTRGYVGASFAVGRNSEMESLNSVYNYWKEGYNGSVLLVGNRFCGKTFLGEYFINSLKDDLDVVKMTFGEKIRYKGRKQEVSSDLEECLSFIAKDIDDKKRILWIDDLELFWDAEHDILNNTRALQKFLENYSDKFFVICSMNKLLFSFLDNNTQLNFNFQTKIDCSYISNSEIIKGILIRHQATHSKIVDSSGLPIQPKELRRRIRELLEHTGNNIGDSFRLWCALVNSTEGKAITLNKRGLYDPPRINDTDSNLLISDLYMQKYSSEYRMRKSYGAAFTSQFRHTLKRLVNLGLIERKQNDQLTLNVSSVNKLIEYMEDIKFDLR